VEDLSGLCGLGDGGEGDTRGGRDGEEGLGGGGRISVAGGLENLYGVRDLVWKDRSVVCWELSSQIALSKGLEWNQ